MKVTKKREGYGLQSKSIKGGKGNYLFFKSPNGSYHAFLEVAAKEAARDCGARGGGNTRQLCKRIWENTGRL